MKIIKRASLVALLVTVASGSVISQAQAQWYPNNNSYQRGNFRNQYGNLLNNIKSESDQFYSDLKSALNQSNLNNRDRENRLRDLAKDLKDQAKLVRDRFNDRKLQQGDIQQLVAISNRMDNAVRSARLNYGGNIRSDWTQLYRDINQLDRSNYNYNNGYYNR